MLLHVLYFLFVLAGLICFLIATFNRSIGKISIGWLGLAFWIAVDVIVRAKAL
jgi:hypothetical protein